MTLSEAFAQVLRERRVALGLTPAALADRAAVPVGTVEAIECGALSPTILMVDRLAAGLAMPTHELISLAEHVQDQAAAALKSRTVEPPGQASDTKQDRR
ncbi:helix-turn-helix domain-containing protein [Caldimonas brevitalea]|nr:helix-turn-helix transcriptional regulator [Caldimonas brevitalea]